MNTKVAGPQAFEKSFGRQVTKMRADFSGGLATGAPGHRLKGIDAILSHHLAGSNADLVSRLPVAGGRGHVVG
jgi:hypothetical protein